MGAPIPASELECRDKDSENTVLNLKWCALQLEAPATSNGSSKITRRTIRQQVN